MAKIVSIRKHKSRKKQGFFASLWNLFSSQNLVIKFAIVIVLILIALTPVLMKNHLLFTPNAATNSLQYKASAWNISDPTQVTQNATLGVNIAANYGYEDPTTTLATAYAASNISQIDGQLWNYLYDYECSRLATNNILPPSGYSKYDCSGTPTNYTYAQLISAITAHLQQVGTNPSVSGFWILDDWPWYDATAGPILNTIHNLVAQYSPGKPTICGFGTTFYPPISSYSGGSNWHSGVAANFTQQGCDWVGIYIYADSYSSLLPASQYDWTMTTSASGNVLTTIMNDLKSKNWNPSITPFMGIAQAYGGFNGTSYTVVPTVASITTQSNSYCQNGATSIGYYASSLSEWPDSISNNSTIASGAQQGITACRQIWGVQSPTPTGNSLPTVTPIPTTVPSSPTPTKIQLSTTPTSTPNYNKHHKH